MSAPRVFEDKVQVVVERTVSQQVADIPIESIVIARGPIHGGAGAPAVNVMIRTGRGGWLTTIRVGDYGPGYISTERAMEWVHFHQQRGAEISVIEPEQS